mmetsp:Transcript_7221/g.10879  ORF Transcript_7221/g.10879 Transcript_7221/m.10879 type:complete len:229 (+) Transcript_7221:127-813(+)
MWKIVPKTVLASSSASLSSATGGIISSVVANSIRGAGSGIIFSSPSTAAAVRNFATKEQPTNYFQILNQPQSYEISLSSLKQTYQSQMKLLHPDKHSLSSPENQQQATIQSTQVTNGYQILKNNYNRALHLLELNGHGLEDTDGMSIDGDVVGMDVLMLVMEVRELVEEQKSDKTKLQALMQENEKRIEDTTAKLKEAFERDDMVEAKQLVATLQYWNRIHETITEKL